MTDHTAIERGVALVGELKRLDAEIRAKWEQLTAPFDFEAVNEKAQADYFELCSYFANIANRETIIAALEAAGEMVAAPASPDVEKVSRAIYVALSTAPPEADRNTVAARAAIAAIGRT